MPAIRLRPRRVEKVWGRRDLPQPFGPIPADQPPVGEIWFDDPRGDDSGLLFKYLFTSHKVSVQVHPGDSAARAAGIGRGKDEAWWVVSAEEGAAIALGLCGVVDASELRAAAVDGRIDQLLDWRPVRAGDSYYSPAGTIHAIGAGLVLIEIQQNANSTYRLFDYGRDRELHLDDAVAVADLGPYRALAGPRELSFGRTVLADGAAFVLERWAGLGRVRIRPAAGSSVWLLPLAADSTLDGEPLVPGEAWRVHGETKLVLGAASGLLVSYPGGTVHPDLLAD